jgi:hypothetical protein
MKRVFAIVLAAACVVGSTPSFARGGGGHGFGRGGFARNPTTLLGASPPASPTFQSHIPAPLSTFAGTRDQRTGGAEPVWRRYVSA